MYAIRSYYVFLYCLTSTAGSVVDKKEVMAHEKDGDLGHGWLKTGYAGSGPYTLRIWKASEIMMLDANKNYWGDAPKLKRIIIRQIAGSRITSYNVCYTKLLRMSSR